MKISYQNKFLYVVCSLSLFIELFFNIDSAGSGGFALDFETTWPLVENPFKFSTDLDIKFPSHYYIAAIIYGITNDKDIFRLIYCFISLLIPYIFFLCLKIKFYKININNLFLFSLIIFLIPSFRSAAIWPNTQITGIFFFLIALLFFLKWEIKKQFTRFNKELFFTIIFMSLTVYTRQLYAMIFFYLMILFYLNLNSKTFLKTFLIVSLLALPGAIFVFFWPKILKATFEFKPYNSLLVNSSIISFFLIPFYSILIFFKKKIILNKNIFRELSFCTMLVFVSSIFFNYNYLMGGGYFIKLSQILFGNLSLFYLSSIAGFYFLYQLSKENKLNLILILIIILSVSAYIIFMKYFEPMFIFILFLLLKSKLTTIFLTNKKYIYYYHIYFLLYLSSAIINSFLLLSKNI